MGRNANGRGTSKQAVHSPPSPMAKRKKRVGPKAVPIRRAERTTPEDLGFRVLRVGASHFRLLPGEELATAVRSVRPGATLRRLDGWVWRGAMWELATQVHGADPATLAVETCDVAGATYWRAVWPGGRCLAVASAPVTPAAVWPLIAAGEITPADTLWVPGDAVTVMDAERIAGACRLRLM